MLCANGCGYPQVASTTTKELEDAKAEMLRLREESSKREKLLAAETTRADTFQKLSATLQERVNSLTERANTHTVRRLRPAACISALMWPLTHSLLQDEVGTMRAENKALKEKIGEMGKAHDAMKVQANTRHDELHAVKRELERTKKILAGKQRELEQVSHVQVTCGTCTGRLTRSRSAGSNNETSATGVLEPRKQFLARPKRTPRKPLALGVGFCEHTYILHQP